MGFLTTVRPAKPEDIPQLAEYWYDNAVLFQQMQPGVMLAPDAISQWQQAAEGWLLAEDVIFLTGLTENGYIVGGIIAAICPNHPGFAPDQYARLLEIVLDIHTPHTQGGTGGILLDALRNALVDREITRLEVMAPVQIAVQQAFWRSAGAKRIHDTFWLKL